MTRLAVDDATVRPGPARELRIFISSTFRDLEREREHLAKFVFPELRRLCRARGAEFTEIDLRWGVTREESERGEAVRVCLEDIDRCRPFFLGILGDRYGWIPRPEDVAQDAMLHAGYPWIVEEISRGLSLTEIEFRHGALAGHHAPDRMRAFFYLRTPGSEEDTMGCGDRAKLEALRAEVRRAGAVVREFEGTESLGQLVRDDLAALIANEFPGPSPDGPLQEGWLADEEFAASRRASYVAREGDFDRFDRHVARPGPPLVLSADSGLGKSALIAAWAERYRRRNPDAFLITLYIGADDSVYDELSLLLRIMAEIRHRYGLDWRLPEKDYVIRRALPTWLNQIRKAREILVVVIDGLNQLDRSEIALGRLPDEFPPYLRLIFTTAPGPALDALRQRGWDEWRLAPLDPAQAKAIYEDYLQKRYAKKLDAGQREKVSSHPEHLNPLFLRTLLEELRLHDRFETLDACLDSLLQASDLDGLFLKVLQRLEGDHPGGPPVRWTQRFLWGRRRQGKLVPETMKLLWGSRGGVSEADLASITGESRLALSRLLLGLGDHLMRRQGRLAFFHTHLRASVEARYLRKPATRDAVHLRLAGSIAMRPPSDPAIEELPWQLLQAGAWRGLKACLLDPCIIDAFSAADRHRELLGYWLALLERADIVQEYRAALRQPAFLALEAPERVRIIAEVADLIAEAGRYRAAEGLYREGLELARTCSVTGPVYATLAFGLGMALRGQGRDAEAAAVDREFLKLP